MQYLALINHHHYIKVDKYAKAANCRIKIELKNAKVASQSPLLCFHIKIIKHKKVRYTIIKENDIFQVTCPFATFFYFNDFHFIQRGINMMVFIDTSKPSPDHSIKVLQKFEIFSHWDLLKFEISLDDGLLSSLIFSLLFSSYFYIRFVLIESLHNILQFKRILL